MKTRSCTLVNDDTLIDLSPDILVQAFQNKLNLSKIKRIFFTHSHFDHLDIPSLMYRFKEGASHLYLPEEENFIDAWGGDGVWKRIEEGFKVQYDAVPSRLHFHKIYAGDTVEFSDLKVTALKANHMKNEECLVYILDDGEKAILYANDTGKLPEESVKTLLSYDKAFSLLSLDCARGTLPGDGHMGITEIKELVETLRKAGKIADDAPVLLNHYSHMCNLSPSEFNTIVAPFGMSLTYDGQKVFV